jgi:hypothetical protein
MYLSQDSSNNSSTCYAREGDYPIDEAFDDEFHVREKSKVGTGWQGQLRVQCRTL